MATDFAPGFQKKFHEKVIAALLQTMEDQGNQRVQAHAAAALINFTEDCPKSLLIPYLDNLVKHLHSIMVLKLQEVSLCQGRESRRRMVRPEAETLSVPQTPKHRQPTLQALHHGVVLAVLNWI